MIRQLRQMALFLRFAWRELRMRPSRPILTLLSIVIGVGAVVAVTISASTAHRAFDEVYKAVAGQAALEVSAGTGTSFDEKLVPKIAAVPGVEAAAPMMKRLTKVYYQKDGKKRSPTMSCVGVDPTVDHKVRSYAIVEGKDIFMNATDENPTGILLDASFAKSQGIKVGDEVEIDTPAIRFLPVPVVGLYTSNEVSTSSVHAPIYLPLDKAQICWNSRGRVDFVQVKTVEGADDNEVAEAITAILPTGVTAAPPATHSEMANEMAHATEQGMRMARGFSLLVAAFIIANTFLINVAQRRRQIGIMRAIGATRMQIGRMMIREAALMGVVGTILGSLLGFVAAHYLTMAMGRLYLADMPGIQLHWYPFLIGGACGLGISLFAAIFPTIRATRLSPLEAMRDVLPDDIEGANRWMNLSGVFVLLGSIGAMAASALGILPMQFAVWAGIGCLAGLVLLLPLAMVPLSKLTQMLISLFWPIEGRLGRLQILRHRSRTTLTVGVVFLAAATGIALANSIMDNVNNVKEWYRKSIVADFYVRADDPNPATGLSPDLPEGMGEEIKKIEGIKSINALRIGNLKAFGDTANVLARDHVEEGPPDLEVIKGNPQTLRESFKNGAVALSSILAQKWHLNVGDQLKVDTEKGPKSFPVAAIVNDYNSGGLALHMERSVARLELGYEGVSAYLIKVEPGKGPEVRGALQKIAEENGVQLQTSEEIRAKVDRRMSGVEASLWSLVVLGLIVSGVGVTNTLTMNVLEQTRELGLLRIVAMTKSQVRKAIISQAMVIAMMALIPGIVAGVSVAYLINVAMMPVLGRPIEYHLYPWLLVGCLIGGFIVVSFAAIFPANRAAKLDLLEAVRTL